MSKSGKGTRIERRALRLLEARHAVHRATRRPFRRKGKWMGQSTDIFGCDLIAKLLEPPRAGELVETRNRWIQVTAGRDIGRKKAKLAKIPWNRLHDSVEIWRWVGGGGKRIDRRTGRPRQRLYFQVYHLDDNYRLDPKNRVPWRPKP